MRSRRDALLIITFLLMLLPVAALGQTIESAGSRAPGMGGAFVAVADDSSATWWNPAGLAAGPFVDLGLAWNTVELSGAEPPAWRGRLFSVALGTPPAGISYYPFRQVSAGVPPSIANAQGDREGTRAEVGIRTLAASQLGVTLVHSLVSGIHVGTTLKYVRGKVLGAIGTGGTDDLLDLGADLEGGDADNTFDMDVGVLGVAGPFRAGLVARNLREAALGHPGLEVRLPRQVRLGVAVDAESGAGVPLLVALDADVQRYDGPGGERRVIALGAEYWFGNRRVAARAGGRVNTVGAEERALTAGTSVAVRSGLFVDAHVVLGGASSEQGWGAAARVSF